MADFNQISVQSSLTVIPTHFAALCFNDNKLIFNNRYSISNNTLNLLVDSKDTISIFTNKEIAKVYEFNNLRLHIPEVELPRTDLNNDTLENLNQARVLVFVDGELQPTSAYTVTDDSHLKFNINYTDDYNKLFAVSVYSSSIPFTRITYTQEQLQALAINDPELKAFNRITLPIVYENRNTALFINGNKIPFNAIEITNNQNTEVQLNIPENLSDIKYFDIVKFTDLNTDSINFATSSGYSVYGPQDDSGRKIPNNYDITFKFIDQVKLLIDNIRPGFIIKEKNGYGEAIIVDETFEKNEIKGLYIQPFKKPILTPDEYYVCIPESKSIVDYLAEFDKKYTFLPEVLELFQSLLLDEINDTIMRLREARSIDKVDSIHINKLIKLLGFDVNIKTLNKKQRRELIEELTEFYRIAGTRNSYNLINILQNNLKLMDINQLFTYGTPRPRKNGTLYDYSIAVAEDESGTKKSGYGYEINDVLLIGKTGLFGIIKGVDSAGGITDIELETDKGFKEINQSFSLEDSALSGVFNINSTPNRYRYDWIISDETDCLPGMVLYSSEKKYGIKVDEVINGKVTKFTRLIDPTVHDPNEDTKPDNFSDLALNRLIDKLTATIKSTPIYDADLGEPVYTNEKGADIFSLELESGAYFVRGSGGGGGGAAADIKGDTPTYLASGDGSAGELKTGIFVLNKKTTVTGKVGQGGGRVKAKGHDAKAEQEVLGSGFNNGELSNPFIYYATGGVDINPVHVNPAVIRTPTPLLANSSNNDTSTNTSNDTLTTVSAGSVSSGGALGMSIGKYLGSSIRQMPAQIGNAAGGQGGGSTGIRSSDGTVLFEARGGNGGDAAGTTSPGGKGGGGGVTSGQGAPGGASSKGEPDNWHSKQGSDGWIEIYKMPIQYSLTINGDTSTIGDGEKFITIGTNPEFTITAHRDGAKLTFELTPSQGYPAVNGTFNLKTQSDTVSAKLSMVSVVIKYDYSVNLIADTTHIYKGVVFINSDSPLSQQFQYTVTKDFSTQGDFVPKQGIENIILTEVPAYTRQGRGAEVIITSEPSIDNNEDRCYIDFYTKQELGAKLVQEFRSNTIEYGTITQGTPKSPQFWNVGEPDIEYGLITQDTPSSPNPTEVGFPDIAYGETEWDTDGEWVEYWLWNREKELYPTNHVNIEMKLPAGVDFTEYVNTFVEQFYKLASTVVYIHQITQSFYFGNDATPGSNSIVTNEDGILGDPGEVLGIFGITSTMPFTEHEAIVTSDPERQYTDPIGFNHDVTIIPQVPNATVKIIETFIDSEGNPQERITYLTEADHWTMQVKHNTTITYEVTAPNYNRKYNQLVVTKNIIRYVVLEAKTPIVPTYCRLTLHTIPEDATVEFTVNNIITTKSHTIYAWSGNTIFYTITHPGYLPHSGSIVIEEDTDLNIELTKEEGGSKDWDYTINPNKSATLINYKGENIDIVVPDYVQGYF